MADALTGMLDPLRMRTQLGRREWGVPQEHGPTGWRFDHKRQRSRIIVTLSDLPPAVGDGLWIHASISHHDHMPTYADLCAVHAAVWGSAGWSYQVFAARDEHVNIHPFALHLWGRFDGEPALPNFGYAGTI